MVSPDGSEHSERKNGLVKNEADESNEGMRWGGSLLILNTPWTMQPVHRSQSLPVPIPHEIHKEFHGISGILF